MSELYSPTLPGALRYQHRVARADAIVSWNSRHIVRLDKMKAYNQVNLLKGYGILTIITPKEALAEDGDPEETV